MKKNHYFNILLNAILLSTALTAWPQSWLDYDQVLLRYPLLHTANAAALTTYAPPDSSQLLLGDAQLVLSTTHGHLDQLHLAPHAWQAQGLVRSIYRMGSRVVVRGMMDYSYGWGSGAGGSVWIDPEQMPFDITETSDSTRGNISLETYHLSGQAGVDVGKGFNLGVSFDYTTGSGAKKKDPRHTNTLMLTAASAGIMWHHAGWHLGGNYLFARRTEALKFSTAGRSGQVYHYLIDQGAQYGREESTEAEGYVGTSHERPLLDTRHGAALQAEFSSAATSIGLEGMWSHRQGHYGIESPSMIDYNRHHGHQWWVTSWWKHATDGALQRVAIGWNRQAITDLERTYRTTTQHGVTDVNYFDDRLMGKRHTDVLLLTGDLQWGVRHCVATWEAQIELSHHRRSLTATLFPFYRRQQIHHTDFIATGTRRWILEDGHMWTLAVQAGWVTGGGTASHDGTFQTPAADAPHPAEQQLYLMRQFELLTAHRVLAGASVQWLFQTRNHALRPYVKASYRCEHAWDTHYLDDGHRHHAALTMGCQF